jgi:hypothetical protein
MCLHYEQGAGSIAFSIYAIAPSRLENVAVRPCGASALHAGLRTKSVPGRDIRIFEINRRGSRFGMGV